MGAAAHPPDRRLPRFASRIEHAGGLTTPSPPGVAIMAPGTKAGVTGVLDGGHGSPVPAAGCARPARHAGLRGPHAGRTGRLIVPVHVPGAALSPVMPASVPASIIVREMGAVRPVLSTRHSGESRAHRAALRSLPWRTLPGLCLTDPGSPLRSARYDGVGLATVPGWPGVPTIALRFGEAAAPGRHGKVPRRRPA